MYCITIVYINYIINLKSLTYRYTLKVPVGSVDNKTETILVQNLIQKRLKSLLVFKFIFMIIFTDH